MVNISIFGSLPYVKTRFWLFLALSLYARFMQGVSRAVYSSVSFAYVPILWPDSVPKKISILESMTG